MIMNNGTCDDAMAKLRKGLDKVADVTPETNRGKLSGWGTSTPSEIKEANAQTRGTVKARGRLKKTNYLKEAENRARRRFQRESQEKPQVGPKRRSNRDYRSKKNPSRRTGRIGGKRTRKKRRRKKNTRRKKRKRKKTRRK